MESEAVANIESRIARSIDLYRKLLEEYCRIESFLTKSYNQAVLESSMTTQELCIQIQELDDLIESEYGGHESLQAPSDLVKIRIHLMKEVYVKNRSLRQKIRAILAVLGDEIQQAGKNKRLTSAYKQCLNKSGNNTDISRG